jgi:ABC-type transport system involved in multi-copper enzyme maturation permease subunit
VIGQTLAMFLDAYRELNAKKMFWIVLVISGLVVAVFGAVGVKNGNLAFLWFETAIPMTIDPADLYKLMFSAFGISVWLAFAATILALISTASIFPDFITGGSIDLYLSKPMSRLRLFVTKYFTGLLFVALQVGIFATASYLVIGLRGGVWEPGIFLSVPLLLCFFSYLFAVCVLLGVVTRSTLAAVLLTMLFWFFLFCLDRGEVALLGFKIYADREASTVDKRIAYLDGRIASMERRTTEQQAASQNVTDQWRQDRAGLVRQRDSKARRNLTIAHQLVYAFKTALPKTRETTEVMNRRLLRNVRPDTQESEPDDLTEDGPRRNRNGPFTPADVQKLDQTMRSRSLWWVIGTSLAFEAVVLMLAAWVFCRRDF